MKAALSVVLAGLLLVLPVEQVFAQAVQQRGVSVQQPLPSDPAASLFRVPPLTENSARLLRNSSDPALLNTDLAAPIVQESGWFDDLAVGWKVLVITAAVAVTAVLVFVFVFIVPHEGICGPSPCQ